MERERLTELMDAPERITPDDIAALRDLGERFPWFSGAHLLRAAGAHAANDVFFDETLRTVAAHIPARSVLYDVVHKPKPGPVSTVHVVTAPEVLAPAPFVPESVAPPNDPEGNPPKAAPSDELDQVIRTAALNSSYELLMGHATLPEPMPHAEVSPTRPDPVPPPEPHVPGVPLTPQESVDQVEPVHDRRMSFTAWLGAMPRSMPEPAAPPSRAASILSDVVPVDTATLIDRFIRQSTPAPRPKTEFYTPQQAAKRSLDDTAGLVTETLARIHVEQGNLGKAIEAYGKLALKYPARSAYFAALQKELEEQLHK